MALTNGEEMLIDLLKKAGLTQDETVGTMLALRTKEEREELLLWMYRNRTSLSSQELLRKVMCIVEERDNKEQ